MKKLKMIFIFLIIISISWLLSEFINESFAYSYDIHNGILFFEEDIDLLKSNINEYLDDIDDFLIVNSSFELSEILVENYDFLTYFAFDYVLNNYEYYDDKIILLDDYFYKDKYFNEKSTNKYINVEEIYKITDKYFGIRDYILIDSNVNIIDDNISLLDYTNDNFSLGIDNIDIKVRDDLILAYVYYEGDFCYLYTFNNQNNLLKIRNIEVIS